MTPSRSAWEIRCPERKAAGAAGPPCSPAASSPDVHNVATLGAQSHEIESLQLPAALALKPDVVSVVCGLNDTLRGGFDPERTGGAVGRIVAALRVEGAVVLTMRLPDPGVMLGLPRALSRPLARRMQAVNTAIDEVAERYGTLHFDAASDPEAYERRNWSVDRMHPNERGHRLIACRFHALLAESGFPVGQAPDLEPTSPPPTRLAEIGWMATKGTAWVVKRSTDLVPALLALAVRERLTSSRRAADREQDCQPNLSAFIGSSGNLRHNNGISLVALKGGG